MFSLRAGLILTKTLITPADGASVTLKDVTINGDGTLNVSTNGHSAAIGGGQEMNVGNIVIEGGTIIAEGGVHSAGIGVGCSGSCGDITIKGGNVTASAGMYGAGIGSCYKSSCGNMKCTPKVRQKNFWGALHLLAGFVMCERFRVYLFLAHSLLAWLTFMI